MKPFKKKILLLGNPVAHSVSPAMQNAAFEACGLPFEYSAQALLPEELPDFFRQIRNDQNIQGLNVTVPHKEAVMGYLDEVSNEARIVQAVNTVVVEQGRFSGFNTDGIGYLRSLEEELGFSPRGKRGVILGAGGAARGILAALCQAEMRSVVLFNRTLERARTLILEMGAHFPTVDLKAEPMEAFPLGEAFAQADLLIQTTSAGLQREELPPIPWKQLPPQALVSDIVYKPPLTSFLRSAQDCGLKIHPGVGMLLYQGVFAFKLWTKREAPVEVMRQALWKALAK